MSVSQSEAMSFACSKWIHQRKPETFEAFNPASINTIVRFAGTKEQPTNDVIEECFRLLVEQLKNNR